MLLLLLLLLLLLRSPAPAPQQQRERPPLVLVLVLLWLALPSLSLSFPPFVVARPDEHREHSAPLLGDPQQESCKREVEVQTQILARHSTLQRLLLHLRSFGQV